MGKQYCGHIVADIGDTISMDVLPESEWLFKTSEIEKDKEFMNLSRLDDTPKPFKFKDFEDVDPKGQPELVTKDHLFLLSPVQISFALSTKTWCQWATQFYLAVFNL